MRHDRHILVRKRLTALPIGEDPRSFMVWQPLWRFLSLMALGRHLVVAAKVSAALVLLCTVGVLCADLPARAEAEGGASAPSSAPSVRSVRVTDAGMLENTAIGVRYRLENADTGACATERDLSSRATAAAEALVGRARTLTVAPTGRFDEAGRAIVFVSIDGRDLGELLIAQGAARPARAQPWCDGAGNS
jgi:hypothetical protein